ncbi:MAG: hypothetical protein Q8T11_01865 [Elusimicrobiota bacterium]|nr:hypothetical protein [Elusimicrobiota bacterium]
MTRFRLLALVLLIGAAPPGTASTGDSIVSAAKAFLKTSCVAAKQSCVEATAIHDGYLAALKDADACAEKACPLPAVHAIIERDRELDAREHALPPEARAAGSTRPFLRLSLLVVGRSAAALALADPKAEAPAYWNPSVEAPKMVELICVKYAALCAGARGLLRETSDLHADAAACEKEPCRFAVQEELAIAAERASGDYMALSTKVDTYTLPIFSVINQAVERVGKLLARTSAAKLAELEKGEAALLAGVAALEKNPGVASAAQIEALNARGAQLIGLYRDASNSSDRTQNMLIGDAGTARMRERVNAAAGRLASARARLMALKAARGFGGPDATDAAAVGTIRPASASSGAGLGLTLVGGGESRSQAPRPVLIDRRSIPKPPPTDPNAPPILEGDPGYLDLLRNVRSKDSLRKADALRRLGLTKTFGDPSGRAGLVHTQRAPDTCAIVAQQGVLMALKLLPLGDPVKLEAQLAEEARSRGFYREGTPDAYTGSLLVDRGVIVTKHNDVPLSTLDAAVRRGGMIIASVDARHLWGDKAPKALGHAIMITGAEVGRFNDETLGYYINDSGSLVLGAGRFVPIEQFKKAWEGLTKTFAEVH